MRKITPVLESELPKLPDGWHWFQYGQRWSANDGADAWDNEVAVDETGITIGHVSRFDPSPVPFEVITAVLKANGVEL